MISESLATTPEWERRIGADLRRLRILRELTQAELAGLANVSVSSVKRLEDGDGSSLATVVRVVRALGRAEWLAGLAPPSPAVSPVAVLRESRAVERSLPARVRHRRRPSAAP